MMKNTVVGLKKPFEIAKDPLTKLLHTGARKLIAETVEAKSQDFLEQLSEYRNHQVHRQLVRNKYLPERQLQTGIGPVTVKVLKVRDKSGQGVKFNSALLPPYLRKSKSVENLLPWLYLKGISRVISRKPTIAYWAPVHKGCQHQRSVAASGLGKKNIRLGISVVWPINAISTSGRTESISASAVMIPGNVFWRLPVSLNRGEKSLSL